MAEDLDLHRGALTDILDLSGAQLTRKHHPLHPQLGADFYAVQVVDGELGGGVEGQVGGGLFDGPEHAQVLDEHGVHPGVGGQKGLPGGGRQLPVCKEGVHGQVDLDPPDMAILHRRGQVGLGKVFRASSGVEVAQAQVDRVGSVLDGGGKGLFRPSGGEEFQHYFFWLWSLKISRLASLSWSLRSLASSR